jgi:hypothetical protein
MKHVSMQRILSRARLTAAAQAQVDPRFVWAKRATAEWAPALAAVETLQNELVGLERLTTNARLAGDAALDRLHDWTREGLGKARSKYRRDNPEVYQSLRLLRATGGDRRDLLDQSWVWYQAWLQLPDADWTPSAEITKAAFLALHEEARTKVAAIVAAESAEKSKRATLNAEADDLWQDCVEWLEDACLSLAEDTPDGQVVRSVVVSHAADDDEAPQPPPK